jgi:FAD-dependent oxidoreductase domain-containing protein 1
MTIKTFDVAIIGGGGIGSAIAYFLTLKAGPNFKVVVFEKDPTYAKSATTLSAGGIRQQFSTRENIVMSQFGFAFLRDAAPDLAVNGEAPQLGLREWGYLSLVAAERRVGLRQSYEIQRSMGAATEWLEPDEIAKRWPWMETSDVAAGALGHSGEGVFDPYALLQAFRRKAIEQGAEYRTDEVAGIERDSSAKVSAVKLKDGSRVSCGMVINAAGASARSIAGMAGLELPVIALKAHTFAFSPQASIPACPIVMAPYDLLFRPEGHLFICTMPFDEPMRDAGDDFNPDYEPFDTLIWPALARRVPQFETLKLVRAWVGHVEYNTFDQNPILGAHPDGPRNFIFANGFSGHGIQHAPAIGRAMAELILDGAYRSIDLSRFNYERLITQSPVREIAA